MKKVLIISYYWTPAGGPGVQRWLKFVKYLRDFHIEPIVYIPENPSYPLIDPHIGDDLPDNLTIIRHPIIEPYKWASLFSKEKTKTISAGIIKTNKISFLEKMLLFIRGNLFIPDARVLWVKPSVTFLEKYLTENKIDTIITTGPPHSLHLIGLRLKEKNKNLRWIADFRDPWITIGYHNSLFLTKKSAEKHEKLEKKVLNTADQIIVTSFSTEKEFQDKTQKPISVITNGYDTLPNVSHKKSETFLCSHIGSLLSERNPKPLWKAISELLQENKDFANDFELCLAGKVSEEVFADLEELNILKHTKTLGYIPHKEAIVLQRESQLLLLLEINHSKTSGIIAGKLFEYLNSQTPILAMGYKEWDVARIIQETQAGKVVSYEEVEEIKQILLHFYEVFKKNISTNNPIHIEKYHRRSLTEKLSELILTEM